MYLYGIEMWKILLQVFQLGGSNCTFMELKLAYTSYWITAEKVLIVPLWNWNKRGLGIKLLTPCSNCTFMELKLRRVWNSWFSLSVLIVPLWNWNRLSIRKLRKTVQSSNCTFMELKYIQRFIKRFRQYGSNCTFMELKWRYYFFGFFLLQF